MQIRQRGCFFTGVLWLCLVSHGEAELRIVDRPSTPWVVTVNYNPIDGGIWLDTGGMMLNALEIRSVNGIFTGPRPNIVRLRSEGGPFDYYDSNKIFFLHTAGLTSYAAGPPPALGGAPLSAISLWGTDTIEQDGVLVRDPSKQGWLTPPGLSAKELSCDLLLNGSVKPCSRIPGVALYIVPEPSSVYLMWAGTFVVGCRVRRHSRPRVDPQSTYRGKVPMT